MITKDAIGRTHVVCDSPRHKFGEPLTMVCHDHEISLLAGDKGWAKLGTNFICPACKGDMKITSVTCDLEAARRHQINHAKPYTGGFPPYARSEARPKCSGTGWCEACGTNHGR